VVLVLGLTGANAAGKGEVASYLRDRGFAVHSLSDVIRDEAAARGLPPEREHLIRIGNLLRERGGPGVLAERILPRLGERDAVDSIRNPAEVDVLQRLPRFVLLGVRAPLELRFQRSVSRCRPGDPTTLQQFRQREVQENSSDPAAQQLAETFARADRIVENVAGLGELHDQLDRLLVQLDAEKHWPRARDC
jgi:dephospho-CoA kinase